MRHRGVTPPGAIEAPELQPLVEATGPFVTLLLETDPSVPNAGFRLEQRWKNVRRTLQSAGAAEAALAHLEALLPGAHRAGHALYAVTSAERPWMSMHWPDPPRYELSRWASLPTLTPYFARLQVTVPHIVALVDRQGGDLVTVRPDRVYEETITGITGPVVHKAAPGGWSQKRYQHRAEEAWARTARLIAEELVEGFDETRPELVVIAGDVREVQLVRDQLPERVADRTHVVPGGRAPGVDTEKLADRVARLVRTAAAKASVALLEKLNDEAGEGDRAVVGPEAAFDALRRAQVEVLLVHDDPDDHRSAWFGAQAVAVGLEPDDASLDRSEVTEGRLVDVAMRSALGSRAGLRVVPDANRISGGLAAILRWTD